MLGLWIEQLVAESTGKHGKGALPVVDEPLGRPDEYGQDRAFVAISTERDAPDKRQRWPRCEAAGHPVLRLTHEARRTRRRVLPLGIRDRGGRRRAGHQPIRRAERRRGEEAKTNELLGRYAAEGRLEETTPPRGDSEVAVITRAFSGDSPADVVRAALAILGAGRLRRVPLVPAGRAAMSSRRSRRSGTAIGAGGARGHHVRRRPPIPPLNRAVSQGRAEHRCWRS